MAISATIGTLKITFAESYLLYVIRALSSPRTSTRGLLNARAREKSTEIPELMKVPDGDYSPRQIGGVSPCCRFEWNCNNNGRRFRDFVISARSKLNAFEQRFGFALLSLETRFVLLAVTDDGIL